MIVFTESKAGFLSEKPRLTEKDTPLIVTSETSSQEVGSTRPRLSPLMATIKDDDERLLARIGYRQVITCSLHRVPCSVFKCMIAK